MSEQNKALVMRHDEEVPDARDLDAVFLRSTMTGTHAGEYEGTAGPMRQIAEEQVVEAAPTAAGRGA